MYVIQDYKRLKSDENSKLSLGWNLNREISKINYKIHTDAIKEYLLKDLTNEQLSYKYASEADMLNVALFNKRAKQWRELFLLCVHFYKYNAILCIPNSIPVEKELLS